MTIYTFANLAKTFLAAPITPTSTSIQVSPGTGSLFPTPTTGQVFMATLLDAATQTVREIVMVTANAGDIFTVVRGQEGTSGSAYAADDLIQLFMTAQTYQNFIQSTQAAGGSLTGTFPNPSLTSVFTSGAGTYVLPTITISLDGRITSASSATSVGVSGAVASTTSTSLSAISAPNGGVYAAVITTTPTGYINVGSGNSSVGGPITFGSTVNIGGQLSMLNNAYSIVMGATGQTTLNYGGLTTPYVVAGNINSAGFVSASGYMYAPYFATTGTGYISVGTGASSIGGTLYVAGALTLPNNLLMQNNTYTLYMGASNQTTLNYLGLTTQNVTVNGTLTAYIANRFAGIGSFGALGSQLFTVPAGVHYAFFRWVGGGGGGSNCASAGGNVQYTDASGGGGGAGGYCEAWIAVVPGTQGTIIVGAGGSSQAAGGTTIVAYGSFSVGATGGGGANFSSTATGSGGAGGSVAYYGTTGGLLVAAAGGWGSDGQSGSFIFAGNGGASAFGGGGRAGSHAGVGGSAFGSGGGGAYDQIGTSTNYPGGAGAQGVVYVVWYS